MQAGSLMIYFRYRYLTEFGKTKEESDNERKGELTCPNM